MRLSLLLPPEVVVIHTGPTTPLSVVLASTGLESLWAIQLTELGPSYMSVLRQVLPPTKISTISAAFRPRSCPRMNTGVWLDRGPEAGKTVWINGAAARRERIGSGEGGERGEYKGKTCLRGGDWRGVRGPGRSPLQGVARSSSCYCLFVFVRCCFGRRTGSPAASSFFLFFFLTL